MNRILIAIATAGLTAIMVAPAQAHDGPAALAVHLGPEHIHADRTYRHVPAHRRYDRDHRGWRKYEKRRHKEWRRLQRKHDRWHRRNDHRRDRYYYHDHARLHRHLGLHPQYFHGPIYRHF